MRWLLLLLALCAPLAALAQTAAQDDKTAALIADSVRVEGDNTLVADGSVEVLYGTVRLRASRISYDRRGGKLTIEGPIYLVDASGAVLVAQAGELSDDLRNGILRSARLVLDQQLQFAAAQIRRVDGRYTELRRTVASSCQVCTNRPVALWSIRADRVVHDQLTRKIWFENAVFRVLDVPVFWLPRMRLPDPTVDRASGFLVPQFRQTSQLGIGVKIPYFFVLSPSRDITVTPYLSPHTRTLELRYRQAFRAGRLEFTGAVSRDDIQREDTRAYLFGSGAFDLPDGFGLSFGIELTSDPAYLLDYGYSGKDRLASFVRLERVRRDELIVARLINFRTLRDSEIPIEDTLPYLLGEARWEKRFPGVGGGEGRLGLSLQGHQRVSDLDGLGRDVLRLGGEAGWRKGWIIGPGIEAVVDARLALDGYLVGQDSAYPTRFGRATPALGATFRWPFARNEGNGVISVIEPVVALAWSDTWGDTPPDEDSQLVEFDEGNLFALDRFPGSDRKETGFRAAVGLSYSRFGAGWDFGAALGRVVRAEPADFSRASGLDGRASDWLAAFHLTWDGKLGITSRSLIDDSFHVTRSETRLSYSGQSASFGLGHVWVVADPAGDRPKPLHELTLDGSWQASRNWTGAAALRYDLSADQATSASLGLGYRNECVSVDLSLSRRFTSSTSLSPTTDVGLKISLGGFGGNDGRAYRRSCGG